MNMMEIVSHVTVQFQWILNVCFANDCGIVIHFFLSLFEDNDGYLDLVWPVLHFMLIHSSDHRWMIPCWTAIPSVTGHFCGVPSRLVRWHRERYPVLGQTAKWRGTPSHIPQPMGQVLITTAAQTLISIGYLMALLSMKMTSMKLISPDITGSKLFNFWISLQNVWNRHLFSWSVHLLNYVGYTFSPFFSYPRRSPSPGKCSGGLKSSGAFTSHRRNGTVTTYNGNKMSSDSDNRGSTSGSDSSLPPLSIPTSSRDLYRLPRFCHDCGTKYPIATAKYCCECGVRRFNLDAVTPWFPSFLPKLYSFNYALILPHYVLWLPNYFLGFNILKNSV